MSEEADSSNSYSHENNHAGGRPAEDNAASTSNGSSSTAAGSIGSLHTPTGTPAGRLTSLRGGRGGGAGAGPSSSTRGGGERKMKFVPVVPTKRNKKDA
ncbi:hypothetical protein BGZ58_001150, partial [Dissophora ornata]